MAPRKLKHLIIKHFRLYNNAVKDLEELYELLLKEKQKLKQQASKTSNTAGNVPSNTSATNQNNIVLPTEYILTQVRIS